MDKWLEVPGMHMTTKERVLIKNLARKAREMSFRPTIINIGIAGDYGYCSMRCIRAGCPEAFLIGIDIEDQGEIPEDLDPSNTAFLIGDSKKLLDENFPLATQFAFVDGDHTEQGVSADIKNLVKLVMVKGYIAFHDYGNRGPGFEHVAGVHRAVDKAFNGNEQWRHVGDADSIRVFQRVE